MRAQTARTTTDGGTRRRPAGGYRMPDLQLAVKAEAVTDALLERVIAKIALLLEHTRGEHYRVLIEIDAPPSSADAVEPQLVRPGAELDAITGARFAYVVSGRPMPSNVRAIESAAQQRGVELKMFAERKRALEWLQQGQSPLSHLAATA